MSLLGLTLAAVLAQTPPEQAPGSAEERAAAAAEKAAAAAERVAAAAERIAGAVAPAPPPAAPAEEKKPDNWTGSAGVGLTFITGNSQTLTLTGTLSADRKWQVWTLGLRLNGAYGLANPSANVNDSTTATTARRAAGTIRADRAFGGFASVFGLAGSELDHVKNIESRSIAEVGTGLTFFNIKEGDLEKLYLRLDLAMRTGFESRYQYFPAPSPILGEYGIIILAPRVAATMRWNHSKDVRVTEELEITPFVLAPNAGRLLVNNTTKLSSRLTENVALTMALIVNYDSTPPQAAPPPAPQRLSTDVALTAGLEATF